MRKPARSLFRSALKSRRPALGTWIKIPAMESMELVALAGFDFTVIDLEHAAMSIESAYRLIGTALLAGVAPIVRVPTLDAGIAQRILDAGAEGIMVPHVDIPEQAVAAAAAVRFPPIGTRGIGATSRAGGWGSLPVQDYVRYGQEEVVLIAQLESVAAVHNASQIARIPGVTAMLVGAADLAASACLPASDPTLQKLARDAVSAGNAAGIPVGNAGGATAAAVKAAVDTGYSFTLMSNDASLLGAAAIAAVTAGRSVSADLAERRTAM